MDWKEKAISILKDSLVPVPTELNELDWKSGLPAVKFTRAEQHTRIFLFPPKRLSEMTKEEKVLACYQHACLMYEDNNQINNQSVRERFGIEKNKSWIASRIITDTLENGLIKISDVDSNSRKYAVYIPYYG